ncbi:MAG: hypothetical protein ABI700_09685 [Chloroflexota bacterium]
MVILKSKRFRIALSIFTTLALILVIGCFAMSRGYLIHFLLDDQTISHDQFYHLYDEAVAGKPIHMGCAQGDWTLGWFYVYESHCFTSDDALNIYMKEHFGSS